MSGFSSFLKNFISDIGPFGAFKFWKGLFTGKPYMPYSDTFNTVAGSSLWNKVTGEGLTGAENTQNAFNAQEAQKQRDFEANMSNTQYQRGVADMRAAGINPALAMSTGGASVPSGAAASAGSSPNGMNFSDLLQLLMLKPQTMLMKAQAKATTAEAAKAGAETKKIAADTEGANLNNDWLAATLEARKRSVTLSNDMSEAAIRKTYRDIDLTEANIHKAQAETRESAARESLAKAQELLAKANATQVAALMPFQQAMLAAQTDAQRAAAALDMVNVAYQKKLIDGGYIDAMIDQMSANARNSDEIAQMSTIKRQLRDGTYGTDPTGNKVYDWLTAKGSILLSAFVNLADNFPKIM